MIREKRFYKYSDEELLVFYFRRRGVLDQAAQEAMSILYHRISNIIRWTAVRYTDSNERAENIVQDVFSKITSKDNLKNKEISSLKEYCMVLAKSFSIRELKRNSRKSDIDSLSINDYESTVLNEGELSLDALEDREWLDSILDNLPEKARKIIRLSFFEGLGPEEIALRLGYKNSNTVRSAKHQSIRMLRELVKKKGYLR